MASCAATISRVALVSGSSRSGGYFEGVVIVQVKAVLTDYEQVIVQRNHIIGVYPGKLCQFMLIYGHGITGIV
jgi:hypothetical protein